MPQGLLSGLVAPADHLHQLVLLSAFILAALVDSLLDECRLGEMGNATFERPSVLHLNWKFYFSQSDAV